jgi:hypothetical protein
MPAPTKSVPERACKPGSVTRASKGPARVDGHFSWTPVARRLQQPTRAPSRAGPARAPQSGANALLGLAPGGVCRASRVAPAAGALLPHRFTLTAVAKRRGPIACRGGLLSVALSRALRPVGVTDHPVLWSPDFPPAARDSPHENAAATRHRRPPGSLRGHHPY